MLHYFKLTVVGLLGFIRNILFWLPPIVSLLWCLASEFRKVVTLGAVCWVFPSLVFAALSGSYKSVVAVRHLVGNVSEILLHVTTAGSG